MMLAHLLRAEHPRYRGMNISAYDMLLLLLMTRKAVRENDNAPLKCGQLLAVLKKWDAMPLISTRRRFGGSQTVDAVLEEVDAMLARVCPPQGECRDLTQHGQYATYIEVGHGRHDMWQNGRPKFIVRQQKADEHLSWSETKHLKYATGAPDGRESKTRPRISPVQVQHSGQRFRYSVLLSLNPALRESINEHMDSVNGVVFAESRAVLDNRRSTHVLLYVSSAYDVTVKRFLGPATSGTVRVQSATLGTLTLVQAVKQFYLTHVTGGRDMYSPVSPPTDADVSVAEAWAGFANGLQIVD